MCGASGQQQQVYQAQYNFMNTLTQAYQTQFAGQNAILSQLTNTFEPILAAGPSQQGFSPGEVQNLNEQATRGVAQGYSSAQTALANKEAAQGGGNDFLPSGANAELNAELNQSATSQLAGEENQINLANYAAGRQNFNTAATMLGGAASQMNPIGYAGATNTAATEAGNTANQIAAANNAWMGALGGALGGLGTAVVNNNPGNIWG